MKYLLIFLFSFQAWCSPLTLSLDTQTTLAPVKGLHHQNFAPLMMDMETLALLKYVSASKLMLLEDILKLRRKLVALAKAMGGNAPIRPHAVLKKHYPAEIFDHLYQLPSQEEEDEMIHNIDADEWAEDILQKARNLVIRDLDLFLWKFSEVPDGKNRPSEAMRKHKIQMAQHRWDETFNFQRDRFLLTPFYKSITHKRGVEFFFFHESPNYYLYQWIVTQAFALEVNTFIQKLNPNEYKSAQKATLLNLPNWDSNEKSDKVFKTYLAHAQKFQQSLESAQSDYWDRQLVKDVIKNQILEQIKQVDGALNIFAQEPTLRGQGALNPYTGKSIFTGSNQKFFKHYSFLSQLPDLASRVLHQYPLEVFNPYSLKIYNDQLSKWDYEDQQNRGDQTVTNIFLGLGVVSMFVPFGQVLSPTFFALSAANSVALKAIPNAIWSKRMKDLFSVLNDPMEVKDFEVPLALTRELVAKNMIHQKTSLSLAIALGLEMPFIFVPAIRNLSKVATSKEFLLNSGGSAWKNRFKAGLNSLLEGQGKNQSLGALGLQVLKKTAMNSNVQVAAFYFSFLYALQFYYDHINHGYGKDWEDLKNPDISDALIFTHSAVFEKTNPDRLGQLKEEIKTHMEKVDKSKELLLMKRFYMNETNIKLHDGGNVVVLLDDVYIPLTWVEKQHLTISEMCTQLSSAVMIQEVIQTDALKALMQVNMEEFMKAFLQADNPLEDYKVQYFGKNMSMLFNQNLTLSLPFEHQFKDVISWADQLSKRYESQEKSHEKSHE